MTLDRFRGVNFKKARQGDPDRHSRVIPWVNERCEPQLFVCPEWIGEATALAAFRSAVQGSSGPG
jgi:hypothetical protein